MLTYKQISYSKCELQIGYAVFRFGLRFKGENFEHYFDNTIGIDFCLGTR